MLEADLRRAAFGESPTTSLSALRDVGEPRIRLLVAIPLGTKGRYAAAATILGELRRGEDPLFASLAGSTLASHRRQLGGHAAARGLDGEALLTATTLGATQAGGDLEDPDGLHVRGAFSNALLGLAADNLAVGRVPVARRLTAAVARKPAGWRGRVRAGWVRCRSGTGGRFGRGRRSPG